MNALDNLINKVGNDKVLHFLGGGLICVVLFILLSSAGAGSVLSFAVGFLFVLIISVIKELWLDVKADWYDVLAAMAGCVPVILASGVGILISKLV